MDDLKIYKKNITSQWGEDGIIEEIFNRIGVKNPICVEFGAWDGEKYSNTWNLWNNKDWSAILIERDEERFKKLSDNTKKFNKVLVKNKNVGIEGSNSLDNILSEVIGNQVIDLISIDIDGDDYHIFKSLKKYLPRILVVEHNPTIPENIDFIQEEGEYAGSSALALCNLATKKGYSLVTMTDTNCFFIKNEEFHKLDIKPISIKDTFVRSHITYLMSSFDGSSFLNIRPPYFNDKIFQKNTTIPKTKNPNNFIPIIFSLGNNSIRLKYFKKTKLLIKSIIKKIFPKKFINYIKNKKSVLAWYLDSKPVPPPHIIKQKTIRNYVKKYKIKTFIETGTYEGKMIEAVKKNFENIYSIELDKTLYEKARIKFENEKHIKIIQGDSGEILKKVLEDIKESCLFWLDGHYSGGTTAKGNSETPIYKELETIFSHKIKNHIILIDDARLFVGKNDYPTVEDFKTFIKDRDNKLKLNVKNDIIKIICQG